MTAVTKGSPAQQAGLVPGDIVLSVNGAAIDHPDALGYRLDTVGVGKVAALALLSRGKETTIEVKLITPPETVPREEIELPQESVLWGARVANLSPAVALEIGLGDAEGVVVVNAAREFAGGSDGTAPRRHHS